MSAGALLGPQNSGKIVQCLPYTLPQFPWPVEVKSPLEYFWEFRGAVGWCSLCQFSGFWTQRHWLGDFPHFLSLSLPLQAPNPNTRAYEWFPCLHPRVRDCIIFIFLLLAPAYTWNRVGVQHYLVNKWRREEMVWRAPLRLLWMAGQGQLRRKMC